MKMVLSLHHWPNAWIFWAVKERNNGKTNDPPCDCPYSGSPVSPSQPRARDQNIQSQCRAHKGEPHKAKRDAVWIVKKNYVPIIEKHTDPWFGSQAAVL